MQILIGNRQEVHFFYKKIRGGNNIKYFAAFSLNNNYHEFPIYILSIHIINTINAPQLERGFLIRSDQTTIRS